MKKTIILIAFLALATCTCSEGQEEKPSNNDSLICVVPIENCKIYNNSAPNKCAQCFEGYKEVGDTYQQADSCCRLDHSILTDEAGNYLCGKPILGCYTYQENNPSVCKSCNFGFSGTDVTECTCPYKVRQVHNKDELYCIEEIPNCFEYEDQLTCKFCLNNSELNSDENNCCVQPKKVVTDDNSAKVCALPIKNCKTYLNTDSTKCYECDKGFNGTGGQTNAWESCTCDSDIVVQSTIRGEIEACEPRITNCVIQIDGRCNKCDSFSKIYNQDRGCCPYPKIVVTAEDSSEKCVDEITGCDIYLSTDTTTCHTCHSSFTSGSGTSQCECGENKVVSYISEGNQEKYVCVDPIPNCQQYDNQNLGKCEVCFTLSKINEPLNDVCCKYPQDIKMDENDISKCVDTIPGCETYLSSNLARCYACASGFTGSGGEGAQSWASCDCAGEIKRDYTGRHLCVENEIKNCLLYDENNVEKCNLCLNEYLSVGQYEKYDQCCDPETEAIQIDQNRQQTCGKIIPGCQFWLSSDPSKCFMCKQEDFEPGTGGSENAWESCQCRSNKEMVEVYIEGQTNYACFDSENLVSNCSVYNLLTKECETCTLNAYQAEDLCCLYTETLQIDEVKGKSCGKHITGCSVYSSTQKDKCYACSDGFTGKGASQAYDSCDCAHELKKNQVGEDICIENVIPNCKNYLNVNPELCYECDTYYAGMGKEYAYESCCQASEKTGVSIRISEKYLLTCADRDIKGCLLYLSSNPGKCHTCLPGFTGQGGSENAWDSCICDEKSMVLIEKGFYICADPMENCVAQRYDAPQYCWYCNDDSVNIGSNRVFQECQVCPQGEMHVEFFPEQDYMCATPIDNCFYYNKDTKKCHTCFPGFTPKGGSLYSYDSCDCEAPFRINNEGTCDFYIENCQEYNRKYTGACVNCLYGFTAIGHYECQCGEGNTIVKNNEGNNACLKKEIPYCLKYLEDSDNCHTCLPGFSGKGLYDELFEAENDYIECYCDPSKIRQDASKNVTFCLSLDISNCEVYASPDTCQACSSSEFVLSSDGKSCTVPDTVQQQPQSSESSQVLGFGLLLILGLVMVL